MKMSIADDLAQRLKREEGWSDHVYKDTRGVDTIGYGFAIDGVHGKLPVEIAEAWLHLIIQQKLPALYKALPWLSSQPHDVQLALSDMSYQMGVDGVLGFKGMLAALQRKDYAKAAYEAQDSAWHNQTPNRANGVIALIRGAA